MDRNRFLQIAWWWFFLPALVVCCKEKEPPSLLESLPAGRTGVDFSNDLFEDEYLNIVTFEYFYNGAGVGAGDVNNDGLTDIFFTANMVSNRLYLNKGDFRFEDITEQAGVKTFGKWATGVAMADVNQDGWPDIYVCYAGPFAEPDKRANELYINNGDNTFTEQAREYGLADTGHTVQAAFFDYDRDGDLDVYLLTNITGETGPNVIRPKRVHGEMVNTDRLYRNNGDGTFTNVSAQAGITIEGYGLGVSVTDIDQDGWPDIYVSNDYLSNDLLYINNGDGTFTNRAAEFFKHTSYSAMGNDVADYNNDALPDVVAVDMLPPDNERQKLMFGSTNFDRYRSELATGYAPQFMRNTLQLNSGPAGDTSIHFSEVGQYAGIHASDWSWSPLLADLDNDGWKDLVVTNGYPHDITNRDFVSYKANEFAQKGYNKTVMKDLVKALNTLEGAYLPNFVYRNNGDLTFADRSAAWGFTQSSYSTGAAYADLDNDGDLDLVMNNTNAPAFIYRNNADRQANRFLKLTFRGPAGNVQGLGTKVWVYCADSVQYFEHSPYRGFQSTVEAGVHVGLGRTALVDSVVILWPDEKQQVLRRVSPDRFLTIQYSEAVSGRSGLHVKNEAGPFFKPADKKYGAGFVHRESRYVDFKVQPLLPHLCSQDGPGIAAGDVNGDGLEDLYVGGAFGQPGRLFVQKKDGTFLSRPLAVETKYEEDMGALLFDADQDGDNDLYIVSGGNEFEQGSPYYHDRLYVNDGKGNFSLRKEALPAGTASGSCVAAADYDRDGDLDLFVGGKLTPQHYPQPGRSYILKNNGGRFEDVTDAVAPGLKHAGMVTAALWTDVNNDGQTDLIVAGEWMPVMIFENKGGKLEQTEDAVPQSTGWWNSICGADFDEDGDTDYVLGNLGLNSRYKASAQEPVRIYVADLNHDGVDDPIMACYIEGVNRPAHPRDDLLLQLTPFKKKYPSYQAYAEATMEHVLGTEASPQVLQCETFASAYLENRGKDGWSLRPLPAQAQFAPVFGSVAGDFNADGHEDVVLIGNSYAPDVLTGRYDAFTGLLLAGDGTGNFKPLSLQQGGLMIDGDAKGLSLLTVNDRVLLAATQNNDSLRFSESTVHVRTIPVTPRDAYAVVTHADGKKSRHEFYFGSGYLSQSARRLLVPAGATRVEVYDVEGELVSRF